MSPSIRNQLSGIVTAVTTSVTTGETVATVRARPTAVN